MIGVSAWPVLESAAAKFVLCLPLDHRQQRKQARRPRSPYALTTSFLLVFLLAIWIVLLLSLIQIRRNLVPLAKL